MICPALEALNTYAVVIRYPGTFATKEDARDAVKAARQVRNFMQSKVGK